MKIVMIFDQIQSGMGTKDDKMLPLGGKPEAIGPAIMMSPHFKEVDGKVIACLYCGNGTYLANKEEVSRKLCAMVKKLNPDIVICGPAFNYADYAEMCAKVCYDINNTTEIKAFAAMSREVENVVNEFKDKIEIVEMPKKGGLGLNDALKNICAFAKAKTEDKGVNDLKEKICL